MQSTTIFHRASGFASSSAFSGLNSTRFFQYQFPYKPPTALIITIRGLSKINAKSKFKKNYSDSYIKSVMSG